MHTVILPEGFRALLMVFARCFHAPGDQNFATLVAG
jgi:hypothetical protein